MWANCLGLRLTSQATVQTRGNGILKRVSEQTSEHQGLRRLSELCSCRGNKVSDLNVWNINSKPYRGFARQPCCMPGTMKIFCIWKNFFSHGKRNLLFLPCNMAAVQNLYRYNSIQEPVLKCTWHQHLFFVKIIKLSFWSNLPQKVFGLVKSSIFLCAVRNRLSDGSRPRMGNLRRVNAVTSTVKPYKSLECRRQFATRFFRWDSLVYRFLFIRTMSSSSSDSEMSFDSEDSEIYYIADVETDEKLCLVTLIEVANSKPNWFRCWRPSSQRRMDSQIQEGGGCWQRTRTNSEWQTWRQYGNQFARGACLLFSRIVRFRIKK